MGLVLTPFTMWFVGLQPSQSIAANCCVSCMRVCLSLFLCYLYVYSIKPFFILLATWIYSLLVFTLISTVLLYFGDEIMLSSCKVGFTILNISIANTESVLARSRKKRNSRIIGQPTWRSKQGGILSHLKNVGPSRNETGKE